VVEAIFTLGDNVLHTRLIDEDTLFSSYRAGRVLHIAGIKVVVLKCSRSDDSNLTRVEVEVLEVEK
jgi:hypothetical protein